MSRIGQGPEDVEDRAGAERLAHRGGEAHRRMVGGCVAEREARLLKELARVFGAHRDVNAKRRKNVRGAGRRGDAAVAVFGDVEAAGRGGERRGGGNVDCAAPVAARADDLTDFAFDARKGRAAVSIAVAAPRISSGVSPLILRAVRSEASAAGSMRPAKTSLKRASVSAELSDSRR
jgi:hypothetical protein